MSVFNVFAAPNAAPSNAECKEYTTSIPGQGFTTVTDCCWTETDPDDPEGIELYYCQECTQNGCAEKRPASQGPTRPPSGPVAPLQGGVLEQLEQNEQPPLFGWNIPQGGFEVLQEPETPPMFGQIAPEGQVLQPLTPAPGEGGEQAQSRTVSPTGYCVSSIKTNCIPCDPGLPVADCTPASEWPPVLSTDEGVAQGTQPHLKTIPPIGEIAPEAKQPEAEEEPQDEGQEELSNEGQETAGPLT
jgi:hypothetical protein